MTQQNAKDMTPAELKALKAEHTELLIKKEQLEEELLFGKLKK